MKFDLGTEVEPLEYDFTTMPGRPEALANAKGTIPEPSSELVDQYTSRLGGLQEVLFTQFGARQSKDNDQEKDDGEPSPKVSLAEALEEWRSSDAMSEEDRQKFASAMVDVVADVCQGRPSREEIAALGHRGLTLFSTWLARELNNPKGTTVTGSTTAPEVTTSA